jgi:RNA-directed DNA polymerase
LYFRIADLHDALDLWAGRWRKREATGMIIVRYADDIIVGFEYESDARCFMEPMRVLRCT